MSKTEPPAGRAFMPGILRRLAPQLGAEVLFEPEYEIVGRIRFPNGRQSYFWHNKSNLNSVASARIAQDKGYTNFFLRENGFRVPESRVFLQDAFRQRIQCGEGMDEARRFAASLNWQVYLKPLRGSQGDGILRACDETEFETAAAAFFSHEKKGLIQEACAGRDYRLVVLQDEVISAYERVPLAVVGDGWRSIAELLAVKQAEFDAEGRDTIIPIEDPRIAITLGREGLDLGRVLPAGKRVRLLDVANLSCGGTTNEVTARLHPSVSRLAVRVARAMDLSFAGVDILMASATEPLAEYTVLEVNSAPGLDHYAGHGPEHEAHIDSLYLRVLQAIERGPA